MASKGGQRKHGRSGRKPSKTRYKNSNQRIRNKLKRVKKSNGAKAAEAYEAGRRASFPRTRGPIPDWQRIENRISKGG